MVDLGNEIPGFARHGNIRHRRIRQTGTCGIVPCQRPKRIATVVRRFSLQSLCGRVVQTVNDIIGGRNRRATHYSHNFLEVTFATVHILRLHVISIISIASTRRDSRSRLVRQLILALVIPRIGDTGFLFQHIRIVCGQRLVEDAGGGRIVHQIGNLERTLQHRRRGNCHGDLTRTRARALGHLHLVFARLGDTKGRKCRTIRPLVRVIAAGSIEHQRKVALADGSIGTQVHLQFVRHRNRSGSLRLATLRSGNHHGVLARLVGNQLVLSGTIVPEVRIGQVGAGGQCTRLARTDREVREFHHGGI